MSTNMELITSVTVGSGGAASVTLPATGTIPQTYTDLKLVMSARSTRAAFDDEVKININGTGIGTNFTSRVVAGEGTSGSQFSTSYSTGRITLGIQGSTTTASTFTSTEHYFPNYTGSNFKSISSDSTMEQNATAAYADLSASLYSSTSAITTIALTLGIGNFVEGSTFYLYGISNVTSTTKATGGIVSSDGTYNYHMFPFSGTFTPTQNITADYLVIAGGGGGAADQGGGGGAGGLRSTVGATGGGGSLESALSLTANTAYTVTVGAGGAAQLYPTSGLSGSNSVFSTITSDGGGGGAQYVIGTTTGPAGKNGGSGGGASGRTTANGGTRTTNQGFNGGNGSITNGRGGGAGGGGAGAAGTNSTDQNGTNGGNGVAISAFANATQTGVNTYYAGGGGGGADISSPGNVNGNKGIGGSGGGGNGGGVNTSPPTSGTVNSGSGGGGGGYGSGGGDTGNGGSGVVIIRYAI